MVDTIPMVVIILTGVIIIRIVIPGLDLRLG